MTAPVDLLCAGCGRKLAVAWPPVARVEIVCRNTKCKRHNTFRVP